MVELGRRYGSTCSLTGPGLMHCQFRIHVLRHGVFEGEGPSVVEPFWCRDAEVCWYRRPNSGAVAWISLSILPMQVITCHPRSRAVCITIVEHQRTTIPCGWSVITIHFQAAVMYWPFLFFGDADGEIIRRSHSDTGCAGAHDGHGWSKVRPFGPKARCGNCFGHIWPQCSRDCNCKECRSTCGRFQTCSEYVIVQFADTGCRLVQRKKMMRSHSWAFSPLSAYT